MDMTFAIGPSVAAVKGYNVANIQRCLFLMVLLFYFSESFSIKSFVKWKGGYKEIYTQINPHPTVSHPSDPSAPRCPFVSGIYSSGTVSPFVFHRRRSSSLTLFITNSEIFNFQSLSKFSFFFMLINP